VPSCVPRAWLCAPCLVVPVPGYPPRAYLGDLCLARSDIVHRLLQNQRKVSGSDGQPEALRQYVSGQLKFISEIEKNGG